MCVFLNGEVGSSEELGFEVRVVEVVDNDVEKVGGYVVDSLGEEYLYNDYLDMVVCDGFVELYWEGLVVIYEVVREMFIWFYLKVFFEGE